MKSLLTKIAVATAASASLMTLTGIDAQASTLGLDLGSGGFPQFCGSCGNSSGDTYGWNFSLSSSINIDGLGVWDAGADGIGPDVQVGLWSDTGTLLASTTVSSASSLVASASSAGSWRFENIPILSLAAGNYVIGSVFFPLTPTAQLFAPSTTIPEVTLLGGVVAPGANTGLSFPSSTVPFPIFGPTFSIADATPQAVPEPTATAGLVLVGIGVAALRKRKEKDA